MGELIGTLKLPRHYLWVWNLLDGQPTQFQGCPQAVFAKGLFVGFVYDSSHQVGNWNPSGCRHLLQLQASLRV